MGSRSPRRPHRELARDPISDGIADVGSHGIGFIEFRQGVAMWIDLPANLLKVLDQVFASGINQQSMLTRMIVQHGVHAVDSILHRWIGAGNSEVGTIAVLVTAKKIFHDLPVGA